MAPLHGRKNRHKRKRLNEHDETRDRQPARSITQKLNSLRTGSPQFLLAQEIVIIAKLAESFGHDVRGQVFP